jgi:O-antigen/teichoic acid export membrane protein
MRWYARSVAIKLPRIRDVQTATIFTNMAVLSAGILSSAVVSRVLGPSGRGEYVAWQTWAATIGVLTIGGLPQVLVLDDWTPGRHRLAEIAAPLAVGLGLALVVAVGVSMALRPEHVVTGAFILIVAATQCGAVGAAEAQRMGHMGGEFNAARALPSGAALVAMSGLFLTGSSSVHGWLVTVGGLQAVAMIVWLVVTAGYRGPARAPVRRTLANSLVLAPGNAITMFQYRFDLLAVAAFFPPETVAFYATGVAAQSAVLAAGQANGMLWFARRNADRIDRRDEVRVELYKTAATATGAAVVLALTSGIWVHRLYGSAFQPAVPVVVVLCGVGVLQSLDYLLAHECLMLGLGGRIPLYRMASLGVLASGFAVAVSHSWPTVAIAALPGLGYALSSVALLTAARSAQDPDLESSASPGSGRLTV